MVISVTCWSCSTSFPVDTNKIPVGGVNARCSSCGDIFRVEDPQEEASPPSALEAWPTQHEEPEAPEAPAVAEESWADLPAAEESWTDLPAAEESWTDQPAALESWTDQPAAEESVGPDLADPMALPAEPAPAVGGFSFGKRDPKDRARRLARVLVSDMISYNPDRHVRALANGSLMADFEDEIQKSWKEYVEQVGAEMAGENPFWVEALNDILANGEQIF